MAESADLWGLNEAPADFVAKPLPAEIARLAAITEPVPVDRDTLVRPTAQDLPEVVDLQSAGWTLLAADQQVIWTAWPTEHRCWVPDRLPLLATSTDLAGNTSLRPLTNRELEYAVEDWTDYFARFGVPPAPPDRVWLVRSPWPAYSVSDLWIVVSKRAFQLSPADTFRSIRAATAELVESEGSVIPEWAEIAVPSRRFGSWVSVTED